MQVCDVCVCVCLKSMVLDASMYFFYVANLFYNTPCVLWLSICFVFFQTEHTSVNYNCSLGLIKLVTCHLIIKYYKLVAVLKQQGLIFFSPYNMIIYYSQVSVVSAAYDWRGWKQRSCNGVHTAETFIWNKWKGIFMIS